MKRKRKLKKKKLIIFILVFLIYSFSFLFTTHYYLNEDKYNKVLNYLLNDQSNTNSNKMPFTKLLTFIAHIDFDNPLSLINNNYNVDNKTIKKEEHIIKPVSINKEIEKEKMFDINSPIVYLYNTHQKEEYSLSNNSEHDIKPTVLTASFMLREILNKNNIPTIVEENDVMELLNINGWNYASSYKISRMLMNEAKEKNNSLVYFIDLHRDSVSKSISTINIDNKNYAKILFIVGLENPNYKENLSFIEELNNMFNIKYPNLSRGIYKKQGKGVNGVYNQDFSKNTILIEVGGQDNTIDEVNNTINAIGDVLISYIKGENYEE